MLKLTVLTPERRLVEKVEAIELTLQGSEGQIQVLSGHAPMAGTIETGPFTYRVASGAEYSGVISGGFFEVKRDDEVTVIAETLELQGEIDLERARKAQKLAEVTLQEANLDEHQFKKYQLKLQRALIRQQVAGK